ncbi:hypothetical protein [Vibrio sp. 1288]|uniref:hypothetical protein n=1 Tax=Vibrio sp. 1288 TaxID=3074550 RepID=UPI0029665973|nr:hypothetical protein [Vibrio sp. 1288]MDW3137067.1 hypothetical protein [Vibrio sp. 1288]
MTKNNDQNKPQIKKPSHSNTEFIVEELWRPKGQVDIRDGVRSGEKERATTIMQRTATPPNPDKK